MKVIEEEREMTCLVRNLWPSWFSDCFVNGHHILLSWNDYRSKVLKGKEDKCKKRCKKSIPTEDFPPDIIQMMKLISFRVFRREEKEEEAIPLLFLSVIFGSVYNYEFGSLSLSSTTE